MQFSSREVYSGDWNNDRPSMSQNKIAIVFANVIIDGKGQLTYLEGHSYIGEWKDGEPFGEVCTIYNITENRYLK